MSWVDLNVLRDRIAAFAKAQAEDAGLEGVRVLVRIEEPIGGRRTIRVEIISSVTTDQVAELQGRPWQDN